MFRKVLIANRGAIACRIIRTLRRMGVASVAVYSEADGIRRTWAKPANPYSSDHRRPRRAIFPYPPCLRPRARPVRRPSTGYGFLSENAEFAEACLAHGIVFIGPTPEQIRDFGLKHVARRIAAENGLPLLPGSGLLENIYGAVEAAGRIGYPVMLKSTAGGGGIGIRLCASPAELHEAFDAVARLSQSNFGSGGLYLERFVSQARHIEVQIFGDGRAR